jgi:hypothetical protein
MPYSTNAVILYEGPSLIDGAPIVVIATGLDDKSDNTKTGDMIQTWIMRSDVAPHHAVKSGLDASVCGDCSLRPVNYKARGKKRPCYVKTFQAPRSVFVTYKRNRYRTVTALEARALFAGRKLRLGSYGNPSAAPYAMWQEASADTIGHTGYIHNWRSAARDWSRLVMASVETVTEGLEARKLGYRLFRVRGELEPLEPKEVMCPASKEAGFKTSCSACNACGGTSSRARADIAIMAH